MPKILYFHCGKDGGAERFFVNLVKALGTRGVEQRFIMRPRRSWLGKIEALGAFVTAVRRLRNDCGFAETLVAGGRMRLEEMFSKNRIVDQYLDLFAGDLRGGAVQRVR